MPAGLPLENVDIMVLSSEKSTKTMIFICSNVFSTVQHQEKHSRVTLNETKQVELSVTHTVFQRCVRERLR